jgi:hypothetical protein
LHPGQGGGIEVDEDLDRRAIRLVAAQGRLGHRDQRVRALRGGVGKDIAGRENPSGLVGSKLGLDAHQAIGHISRPQPATVLVLRRVARPELLHEAADLLELRGRAAVAHRDEVGLFAAVATRIMARTS